MFTVSRTMLRIRGGWKCTAIPAAPTTIRPKPISRTMLAVVACAPVRKSEMTTIGQNSPATADASVFWPRGDRSTPASERIGMSVPSAVVATATAISQPEAPTPAASSEKPAIAPSTIEIPQPSVPRASKRRGTLLWTTSIPARKKRTTSPKSERKTM